MTPPITREHWRALDPDDPRLSAPYGELRNEWGARRPLRGWKIGAHSPTTRAQLELQSSLLGFLPAGTEAPAGWPIDLADAARPGVEAEIAVHVGRAVGPACGEQELADAIAGLSIAAEIIDLRGRYDSLANVVRRNMFHRGYVLPPADFALRPIAQLDNVIVRVYRNGKEAGHGRPSLVLGDVRWVLAFVVETLARMGEELFPGSIILSGVVTELPVWVAAGDDVAIEAGPLGRLDLKFQ